MVECGNEETESALRIDTVYSLSVPPKMEEIIHVGEPWGLEDEEDHSPRYQPTTEDITDDELDAFTRKELFQKKRAANARKGRAVDTDELKSLATYRCNKCPFTTCDFMNFITHKNEHAMETKKKKSQFICGFCPFATPNPVEMSTHIQSHLANDVPEENICVESSPIKPVEETSGCLNISDVASVNPPVSAKIKVYGHQTRKLVEVQLPEVFWKEPVYPTQILQTNFGKIKDNSSTSAVEVCKPFRPKKSTSANQSNPTIGTKPMPGTKDSVESKIAGEVNIVSALPKQKSSPRVKDTPSVLTSEVAQPVIETQVSQLQVTWKTPMPENLNPVAQNENSGETASSARNSQEHMEQDKISKVADKKSTIQRDSSISAGKPKKIKARQNRNTTDKRSTDKLHNPKKLVESQLEGPSLMKNQQEADEIASNALIGYLELRRVKPTRSPELNSTKSSSPKPFEKQKTCAISTVKESEPSTIIQMETLKVSLSQCVAYKYKHPNTALVRFHSDKYKIIATDNGVKTIQETKCVQDEKTATPSEPIISDNAPVYEPAPPSAEGTISNHVTKVTKITLQNKRSQKEISIIEARSKLKVSKVAARKASTKILRSTNTSVTVAMDVEAVCQAKQDKYLCTGASRVIEKDRTMSQQVEMTDKLPTCVTSVDSSALETRPKEALPAKDTGNQAKSHTPSSDLGKSHGATIEIGNSLNISSSQPPVANSSLSVEVLGAIDGVKPVAEDSASSCSDKDSLIELCDINHIENMPASLNPKTSSMSDVSLENLQHRKQPGDKMQEILGELNELVSLTMFTESDGNSRKRKIQRKELEEVTLECVSSLNILSDQGKKLSKPSRKALEKSRPWAKKGKNVKGLSKRKVATLATEICAKEPIFDKNERETHENSMSSTTTTVRLEANDGSCEKISEKSNDDIIGIANKDPAQVSKTADRSVLDTKTLAYKKPKKDILLRYQSEIGMDDEPVEKSPDNNNMPGDCDKPKDISQTEEFEQNKIVDIVKKTAMTGVFYPIGAPVILISSEIERKSVRIEPVSAKTFSGSPCKIVLSRCSSNINSDPASSTMARKLKSTLQDCWKKMGQNKHPKSLITKEKSARAARLGKRKKLVMSGVPTKRATRPKVDSGKGRIVSSAKTYKCEFCDFATLEKDQLFLHCHQAHSEEEKMYICKKCDYLTSRQSKLDAHMKIHEGLNSGDEESKQKNSSKLKRVKERSTKVIEDVGKMLEPMPFDADLTNKGIENESPHTKSDLKDKNLDVKQRRGRGGPANGFWNRYEKSDGMLLDSRPFACKQCPYRAAKVYNLQIHERIHSGNRKPYKCKQCKFAASRWKEYVEHQHEHPEISELLCHICDFTSLSAAKLKSHRMSMHANRTTLVQCSFCNQTFAREELLIKHQLQCNTNTSPPPKLVKAAEDERPFKCVICNFSSKRSGALKKHMPTHAKKKCAFHCPNCNFATIFRSMLVRHNRHGSCSQGSNTAEKVA